MTDQAYPWSEMLARSIIAVQARADDDAAVEGDEAPEVEADGEAAEASGSGLPWDGSDRDYHYEELLGEPDIISMHAWVRGHA